MLRILGVFILFVLFQFFYGGSPNAVPAKAPMEIIAHRGVHVKWREGSYDRATGCEAQHIEPPTHAYIENTLESIQAAFAMGATIVEIDIRRSADNQLVVFHDGMLECRTNGTGRIEEQPLAYLQGLDIGYGYTADAGQSYPFRGKGVGKMPTLAQVLSSFPDKKLLLDHKDGSVETARQLADQLAALPAEQQALLSYWGSDEAYGVISARLPGMLRLLANRPRTKQCFLPHLATIGIAGFPEACRGVGLGMPAGYVRFAWGWPYRFLSKAAQAGVRFYVIVNTEEEFKAIKELPLDGIVTDAIEVIGPLSSR